MGFFEKISNFFKYVSYYFTKTSAESETAEGEGDVLSGKDNVSRRTLTTKLYILEQEMEVFKYDFPNEYNSFIERIKLLKESYDFSLEETAKGMTFEIDPETDSSKIADVMKLEKDIQRFINREVKFHILSKKTQKLIMKLNLLYNVSIVHCTESEKEKERSQIEHAMSAEEDIVEEMKQCDFIMNNMQLKERLINLLSYADYEIFKTSLRSSNYTEPIDVIKKLVLSTKFEEFNFQESFNAFCIDELVDLKEKICHETRFVIENAYLEDCEDRISKLIQKNAYSSKDQVLNSDFWNTVLDLETTTIELFKEIGVGKEKAKISILERMHIDVTENEILTSPKTNAYLALIKVFKKTQNDNLFIMIKLFSRLSNEITYREIYFLLILFDALEVIRNNENRLIKYMQKYMDKYPYDSEEIAKKKEDVKSLKKEEYVYTFSLDDDEKRVIKTLENLNMDFKIFDNDVFINSFYIKGLKNVISSLK